MSIKSRLACEFTLQKIAADCTGGARVRMWTFTMAGLFEARRTAHAWSALSRELVRQLGMWGVRVYELHPGGHGLHVHMITSGWYSVNDVRRVASNMGWGRIHVKVMSGNIEYVAKYLHKAKRLGVLKGLRLWDVVGRALMSIKRTRIIDIESDTTTGRAYKALFQKYFHESIGLESIAKREWCMSLCRVARRMMFRPYEELCPTL